MNDEYLDFDLYPITEEEVISILGNNYKIQNEELVWRCPACPNGDKSGDNLKFNRNKHVLKCFACDYGQEITGIIARRRFEKITGRQFTPYNLPTSDVAERPEQPKEKEIKEDDLLNYYAECNKNLLLNDDILVKMFEKHTILPVTAIECTIGYDTQKDKLVFPSIATGKNPQDCTLFFNNGAEYREYEGEKYIRRISGYEPRICNIWFSPSATQAIICEGYKDAYNLLQYLKLTQPNKVDKTSIFTVQNGTNSINTNNCLQKVNWNLFNKCYLLMDNDDAGNHATEKALDLFPKMIDYRPELLQGYNDVQELFSANFKSQVDMSKALKSDLLKGVRECLQ